MRSEYENSFFLPGQICHLIYKEKAIKGLVRRVLNNGFSYLIKLGDYNFIIHHSQICLPSGFILTDDLIEWIKTKQTN